MGEKVDDVLHKLDSWCNAYPEDLFPEPDQADLNWLHETRRGLCDRISASMGRHMVKHMREMADAIREEVAQHERIVAGLEVDAKRYRAIRNSYIPDVRQMIERNLNKSASELDAAIDAFLAQTAEDKS